MIVTKQWLNEWIFLDDITTQELLSTLNAVGLEVERHERFSVPQHVVIGKVLSCEKHPDANKLHVCRVDIGSAICQIVCGAANVREGLYVAVATIGAHMPSGMVIQPVALRGVDSEGMLCSASEIGLPQLYDGILELDESIGTLELGAPLCENVHCNDDLIEIELTANRGDCLSINGICRDLCAAFNITFREQHKKQVEDNGKGIGRLAHLVYEDVTDVDVCYSALELSSVQLPLLVRLRLALIEEQRENDLESLLFYATYCSGVILRAYCRTFFDTHEGVTQLRLSRDDAGFTTLKGKSESASVIGVNQNQASMCTHAKGTLIVEASYIAPDTISKLMHHHKIPADGLYYRTSRGTDSHLEFGLTTVLELFACCCDASFYRGVLQLLQQRKQTIVAITLDEINACIGNTVKKAKIIQILQNLGFDLSKSSGNDFVIEVPLYRHDIVNKQDIVEEIVRLIGIDNIVSKPFVFAEQNRFNSDYERYKKRQHYRHKAAYSGFFESVHFIFNERATLEHLGFTCISKEQDLLNPITATLDTLRPTLMLNLLESASLNAKSGRKRIALFEIGSVFNAQREESLKMGWILSGVSERDTLSNAGKPPLVDFSYAVESVASVIGDIELRPLEEMTHTLAHPYQRARMIQNGRVIGELFKLHPTIQQEYDLPDTVMAEVDFTLLPYALKKAENYSKFQTSYRDLSLLMPNTLAYDTVKKVIEEHASDEVVRFYPIDRYNDASLGSDVSMTLRFVLQSDKKTLEEEDISTSMDGILHALGETLGLTLR